MGDEENRKNDIDKDNEDKCGKNDDDYMMEGMLFGIVAGVVFGNFGNSAISIGSGMLFGMVIGMCIKKKA